MIASRKGDYVGGLKGNQGKLNGFAVSLFSDENIDKLSTTEGCHDSTREIAHNQLEERDFFMFPLTGSQKRGLFSGWRSMNAIVCYRKHMVHNVTARETLETRYYLTSLGSIEDSAYCIRAHWEVENGLRWHLDTVLMEDQLMLSDRTAALNRSILNKTCLSLYKRMNELTGQKGRTSLKALRKCFGWNFTDMMKQALTLLDPLAFRRAVTITPKQTSSK